MFRIIPSPRSSEWLSDPRITLLNDLQGSYSKQSLKLVSQLHLVPRSGSLPSQSLLKLQDTRIIFVTEQIYRACVWEVPGSNLSQSI